MSQVQELIKFQERIGQQITQAYSNYKKDSSQRKTKEYVQRRLTTLDEQWMNFTQNHGTITSLLDDTSDKYFTSGFYRKVKEMYERFKTNLQDIENSFSKIADISHTSRKENSKQTEIRKQYIRIKNLRITLQKVHETIDV